MRETPVIRHAASVLAALLGALYAASAPALTIDSLERAVSARITDAGGTVLAQDAASSGAAGDLTLSAEARFPAPPNEESTSVGVLDSQLGIDGQSLTLGALIELLAVRLNPGPDERRHEASASADLRFTVDTAATYASFFLPFTADGPGIGIVFRLEDLSAAATVFDETALTGTPITGTLTPGNAYRFQLGASVDHSSAVDFESALIGFAGFSVEEIPAPPSLGLVLAGLALVGVGARRRAEG